MGSLFLGIQTSKTDIREMGIAWGISILETDGQVFNLVIQKMYLHLMAELGGKGER